jgi:putative ABC transport system ATP-binding protein
VLELLQKMSKETKHTVIMVTHNSSFADIANKVIRVKNGGISDITINQNPINANEVSW